MVFDPQRVESPCFVIDAGALRRNLRILSRLKAQTGIRILFAQKSFATFPVFDKMAPHLDGVCASGLYEARLGKEHFGGIVHTFCPAYAAHEMDDILAMSDHVVFNSLSQLQTYLPRVQACGKAVQVGLRVNPECSVTRPAIYDPCDPASRLGVRASSLRDFNGAGLHGLHVHALCERDSHALETVLRAFEEKFGHLLPGLAWVNFGGGHAFTRDDYDLDHFAALMDGFRRRHPHLTVYVEPGAAVVYRAGWLVATVLDVVDTSPPTAILDSSCACHTPDVLEMPYHPPLQGELPVETAPHVFRLGGVSCLAGDVFGTFGLAKPLHEGDRVVFEDMAQYSIVKTTMFNGVRHPSIAVYDPDDDSLRVLRRFGYDDYLHRMG